MSASRKLYQAACAKFKAHRPLHGTPEYATWKLMVFLTANVFAEDNSSFDRRKFLAASGFTAEDVADVLIPV